jgi:hypothetical protein
MNPTTDLMDRAFRHLDASAQLAEDADTITGQALAGQIRLVRALAPLSDDHDDGAVAAPLAQARGVTGHLHAAADAVHGIDQADLPEGLADWAQHLDELAALAQRYVPDSTDGFGWRR